MGRLLTDKEYRKLLRDRGVKVVPIEPYRTTMAKINHRCLRCKHTWMIRPNDLVTGAGGCPECKKRTLRSLGSKSHEQYVEAAKRNPRLKTVIGRYQGARTDIEHLWLCGHTTLAKPNNVLSGFGCVRCGRERRGVSKAGELWLQAQERRLRLKIEREYVIRFQDGTWCAVDGLNHRKRIVFEYYGSAFHGNPRIYASDARCHPFNKQVTAGELYAQTMARERKLKRAGYSIVKVWV